MAFSDKLNGFWEEGYHYYLEFRDEKMTLRRYDRVIELETKVSYDAAAMDRGEGVVITPENDRIHCFQSSFYITHYCTSRFT